VQAPVAPNIADFMHRLAGDSMGPVEFSAEAKQFTVLELREIGRIACMGDARVEHLDWLRTKIAFRTGRTGDGYAVICMVK
jgi:hypothetical protein